MKWSAEAKVGLVTIVGVLLFTFVVLTLAHAEIFGKPGFVIHTEFKDANGLQKGNSVRYVGVHVGKVESVKPSRDGVDVAMKLEKGTEIPRDSKVTITTDGLLGEKIVAITPGNDKNHLLADGDYIDGSQGKNMDDMMDSAGKLMGSADDMVKNINAIIGDEKTQAAMRGSIQNIDDITGKTSQMMDANAGNIQQITANMAAMTAQMNASMQNLDGDGAASANVRATAANMKQITDRFETIAQSMEKMTTDPQTQANIQTTLYNTTKNETSGTVNFKVYRGDTFGLVGAENIGNGTNLNLQYGRRGRLFDTRAGLINGDLGAGLDFFRDGPFRLSLEGYDPDDWRFRLKAQYRLTPDLYLFSQFTRPMSRSDGGNYYGISYAF
ncbi:MlaD family protein [uncultured Megasphaera sp.]|uniref:MlaD family protein n=1 Tax=uncultured Megasphaera sp. TaxID=165188 RepID=UPI00266C0829|nr:MlaD family protein [uncultured Megasphaera sp.]